MFAVCIHAFSMLAAALHRTTTFATNFLIGCYFNSHEIGGTVTKHLIGRVDGLFVVVVVVHWPLLFVFRFVLFFIGFFIGGGGGFFFLLFWDLFFAL